MRTNENENQIVNINFCRREEGPDGRAAGGELPAGASNQISLMKWKPEIKPDAAEATGILP